MCVSLWGKSPEEGMEIHYSILNLENFSDRGVVATVRRGHRVRHSGSNLACISVSTRLKKISLKGEKKTVNIA